MRIFLSYRREDASGHAGRLYDALAEKFGDENVFIDIDTIRPGVDFGEAITRAVASCDAVIALIGREWLTATDAEGRRRLDVSDDFVRLELEAALERDVAVIPTFVQGSEPPRADQLPESLAPLARRQGAELRDVGWRDDVRRLIARLEGERAAPPPLRPWRRLVRPLPIAVAAAALLATSAAVILISTRGSPEDGDGGTTTTEGPFPTAAERGVLEWVPPITRPSCTRTQLEPAAVASLGCETQGVFVAYHLFAEEDDLEAWYILKREATKIAPGSGTCAAQTFRGETRWSRTGGEGGDRTCYSDTDGEPYIVWTDPAADVGAVANNWDDTGRVGIESLLRQWRCCLLLERRD